MILEMCYNYASLRPRQSRGTEDLLSAPSRLASQASMWLYKGQPLYTISQ